MKTLAPLLLLVAGLLAGCAASEKTAQPAPKEGPVLADKHNARNSLDWPGTYEGTLPCADCPGIQTRLVLTRHGVYELQTLYLDRQPRPNVVHGTFQWKPDGSTIRLDKAGSGQQFFVAENRLIQLHRDGSRPIGPLAARYELTQVR